METLRETNSTAGSASGPEPARQGQPGSGVTNVLRALHWRVLLDTQPNKKRPYCVSKPLCS